MLLLFVLACKEPITEVITAEDGSVTLTLVNPTSCGSCDPFEGVEQLRIDVVVDGVVVDAATFTWPSETLTLPALDGFGVVQVQLRGLAAGAVVSFGQTPALVVGPGLAVALPVTFLPINRALPLTQAMAAGRHRHGSIARRDGRVMLFGGLTRNGEPTDSVEHYDPTDGSFTLDDVVLPAALADTRVAEVPVTGERFLFGGVGAVASGVDVASTALIEFVEELGTIESIGPLGAARTDHCVSVFGDTQVIAFGGHEAASSTGEFLRYDGAEDRWHLSSLALTDFDDRKVSGCIPLADGRTFVQGSGIASTGIWAFTTETVGTLDPGAAFLPTPPEDPGAGAAFVVGPSMVALADGDAWVGGGIDPRTGLSAPSAREFRAATMRFDPADAQPDTRNWGVLRRVDDRGTVVWGCGWRDLAREQGASSIEVFNVETGSVGGRIELSEARSGCDVAVLPDGAVLVTGGGAGPSAEIVVPYQQ
ncbi:MAG: hypothetical protein EXR71_14195 [Myxococcales bacterium]|nr:hypothetical protein [Myxococcales bacterium]